MEYDIGVRCNTRRLEIGDNVEIPDIDGAKKDLRNIVEVVKMDDQSLHKIGTKCAILNKLYAIMHQFINPIIISLLSKS